MKKIIFLLGIGLGFVLGSRMGRGPYESLERTARNVAEDPAVRQKAERAKETVGRVAQDTAETVKEKAPEVAEKVSGTAAAGAAAVKDTVASARPTGGDDSSPGDDDGATEAPTLAGREGAAGDAEVGDDTTLSS